MAAPLFSYVNHVDGGTLSASAQSGDLSPSNMASPIIDRVWRTQTLTAYGQVDFGADKTVDCLALRFSRAVTLPTSGTVTHALDADGGTPGAGAVYDSGAVSIGVADGYGYHLHVPASSQTARYWRFTFNITGVDFIDVVRAWAGEAFRPDPGLSEGYADGFSSADRVARSPRSGDAWGEQRAYKRTIAGALGGMTDDWTTARELSRIAGRAGEVLFCKDTAASDVGKEVVIGLMREVNPITFPRFPLKSWAFQITET